MKNLLLEYSEEIIVKGKVSSVFTSKNGHTFINFDKRYPNHTFAAVKFKDSKVDISTVNIEENSTFHIVLEKER